MASVFRKEPYTVCINNQTIWRWSGTHMGAAAYLTHVPRTGAIGTPPMDQSDERGDGVHREEQHG